MSTSENWIDGVGAVVDAKEALPMLEIAVKRLERLAEKYIAEFDFRKFETKIWSGGLIRKRTSKMVPLFSERMPPKIEKAAREKFDVREEIINSCLLMNVDQSWVWQDHLYQEAWKEFSDVSGYLYRARRARAVLDSVKSTIGSGLISLHLNDEGFRIFANLKENAERERVFLLKQMETLNAVQTPESNRPVPEENDKEGEDSLLSSPEPTEQETSEGKGSEADLSGA